MFTLFFHSSGPLLQYDYDRGLLRINNLNPQIETKWRMSQWDLIVLGLKCIWAGTKF